MATRARENADGARLDAVNRTADNATVALKAPLASPVLVTPNLGTPSAGVVTNLSGVLPSGVTGGSGLDAQTGNQVLISTQTASNVAGVAFSSSLITDTYDDYILDINGVVPVTNGGDPYIQMSIDNGSAMSTVYTGRRYDQLAGTASGHEHNDLAHMVIGTSVSSTAADGGISSRIIFHDLRNASKWKHGSFFTSARHSADRYAWQGGFECIATSAINWINFKFGAGNVSSGRFNLYGIKK